VRFVSIPKAMLDKLRTIREMLRIFRSGKELGDVAVLKLTLFSDAEVPGEHSELVLGREEENFRAIELDALKAMPAGSFGEAYARFMGRNELMPFNFSGRVRSLFARYPVSIRYVRVHDMIHVLLGFEADFVGEIGVYAFVAEQNYNQTLNRAARAARLFGKLMFWSRRRIQAAEARGVALAATAKVLVAERLETMLHRPLDEVRQELGLADGVSGP